MCNIQGSIPSHKQKISTKEYILIYTYDIWFRIYLPHPAKYIL